MSVLVGTLAVDVVNGQATFTLDDAKSKLDDFGKKVKDTQETVDYSMREARESITMTGEAFGVRLPAGISRAIASIGPLGPALEAAFPLVAVAAGVALMIEHIKKAKEAQEELTKGFATQSRTIGEHSDELRLSIAKDTAELNKLLGKPNTNGAAISLAEARVEANKLYDSLKKDNDELVKMLEKASHGSVVSFLMPGQSQGAAQARDVAKGFGDALAAIPHDSNYEANVQKATVAAWQRAQYEINKDKQDMQDNSGKNLSKDIEALQELQVHLSEVHDEYQLIGKDDSLKKSIEAAKIAASEVIHVKPPDWKAYEESVKKRKEAEERLGEEQIRASEEFTKAIKEEYTKREKYAQDLAEFQSEQQALDKKQNASEGINRLDNQYKLGLISVKDYVNGKIALLNEEKDAELSYLKLREDMAKQNLAEANQNGDLNARITAVRALSKATQELSTAQTKYNNEINSTVAEGARLSASWANYFSKMKTQTNDLGVTIRTNLQGSITQFTNAFAQNMAKSIVEGKSLGKSMREVGAQILESMISTLIRWVEQWIISHTIMAAVGTATAASQVAAQKALAVQLAGANAIASFSAAPWPIDMGAPAFASSMMAAAAAFEQGGIVPGYGIGDSVPSMLTPGEMVLPKPISQGLQTAMQSGGLGAGETHYHAPNFQPKVHALDSTGVDRVLKKHAETFSKKFHSEMRRRNH